MVMPILILDDEEILTRTFKRLLEKKGYPAMVAESSEAALELVKHHPFSMILSDMRMPGKNGVESVTEIRAYLESAGKPELPVIFLTGFADTSLEARAQALKPLAYIYKPFDALKLLEIIEQYFSTQGNLS